MKNFICMAAIACLALFTSCEKQGVDHTGDDTGKLYGRWVLDTKNVVTEITTNGKTTTSSNDTEFYDDHFFLLLAEPRVALAKEGTLITFNKMLRLSSGFPPRTMTLYGTFDVLELTDKLVLRQTREVLIEKVTTTYAFHRLVEKQP